jgi:hypothetical protein
VPNHVAPDHPWTQEHPEYFIRGTGDDLHRDPASFIAINGNIIAHGRDPYFPAWADVVQLNAFHSGLRDAVIDTVQSIARQCDGIRCDMAMLLMNRIFQRTWGARAGPEPAHDYWNEIIPAVNELHPDFQFIAEAYWDLEWDLQQQGFDYCYDKRLYDRLKHDSAESTGLHLTASLDYQRRLVRFIENHDEHRAAAAFFPDKHKAAAVVTFTLPGMRLLHEGQLEGRKVHLPVFLSRRPEEPVDRGLLNFYKTLLGALRNTAPLCGEWQLLTSQGWPDNSSNRNIVSWLWASEASRLLVAVNLSEQRSQCRIAIPEHDTTEPTVQMIDVLNGEVFVRSWPELINSGLFVDLPPWGFHILKLSVGS